MLLTFVLNGGRISNATPPTFMILLQPDLSEILCESSRKSSLFGF